MKTSLINYSQGLKTGYHKEYYEDGSLKAEGNYEKGVKEGEWHEYLYWLDQELVSRGFFVNGEKKGTWVFFEDNLFVASGSIKDDKREGKWEYYYKDGTLKSEGMYEKGKKTGAWKMYNSNSTLASEGEYVEGEKKGTWKNYFYKEGEVRIVTYNP